MRVAVGMSAGTLLFCMGFRLPGMNGYELGMKFRSHADALEAKFRAGFKNTKLQMLRKADPAFVRRTGHWKARERS